MTCNIRPNIDQQAEVFGFLRMIANPPRLECRAKEHFKASGTRSSRGKERRIWANIEKHKYLDFQK